MGDEKQQDLSHLTPERIAAVLEFGEGLKQRYIDDSLFECASTVRDLLMLARRRLPAASDLDVEQTFCAFMAKWRPAEMALDQGREFLGDLAALVNKWTENAIKLDRQRIVKGIEKVMGEIRGQLGA